MRCWPCDEDTDWCRSTRVIPGLFALLLLVLMMHPAIANQSLDQEDASIWQRNLDLMFRRDESREFARTPEDVYEYLVDGNGFYTQLAVTTIWQAASSSLTSRDDLLNVTLDFGGGWEVIKGTELSRGGISWWLRGGRPVGTSRETNLSTEIGATQNVNESLEKDAVYLREFHWAHGLGRHWRYSVGWIDSGYRYDFNAVANSEREYFIASPLVNSSSIPFPDSGLAANLLWVPSESVHVQLGMYQGNCDKDSLCIGDLDSDEWFAPAELIFQPVIDGAGQGNYRFLSYYKENKGKRGGGFSMSFDQQIGRFTPFLRGSVGDSDITDFKRFFSMGVGFGQPFGRSHDQLGFGIATGKPSDPNLRDETIVELYWRFRINPFVSLTPDLQVVVDPANNPAKDRITVLGLRLQLDF